MTPVRETAEVAIVGAGIVGIAVAHALATRHGIRDVVLVEEGEPMGLTSAQSGENYRNWWPHPVMREFTDLSTGLMEAIARTTGNRIRLTRRGYVLVTRDPRPAGLLAELEAGYAGAGAGLIRLHEGAGAAYRPGEEAGWEAVPDGVDVLLGQALVRRHFPHLAPDAAAILHIRRAGDLSGQALGQYMLETLREAGGRLRRARVIAIEPGPPFRIATEAPDGTRAGIAARVLVNAAGPFIGRIAAMLGETLPVRNVLQQKLAFEDRAGVIPRDMAFTIDLDPQSLPWTAEERALLAADPATAALAQPMPGGIHCRPEGGPGGRWIKLGWAYNHAAAEPVRAPALLPHFPDIVLRAASRLHPGVAAYVGRLPRAATHYGGFYTMTEENWPLVGPMRCPGAYVAGALSGFGTMAACAAGALLADRIAGAALPALAAALSPERQADAALMAALRGQAAKGVL